MSHRFPALFSTEKDVLPGGYICGFGSGPASGVVV